MSATCANCGDPLPPRAIAQLDPFCTSSCCREFHGIPVSKPRSAKQIEHSKAAKMPKAPIYVTTGKTA